MLNPKYKQYADRMKNLIQEGAEVALLERSSSVGLYIQGQDRIRLMAWLTKVTNIPEIVFGTNSAQYRNFRDALPKDGLKFVKHSYD